MSKAIRRQIDLNTTIAITLWTIVGGVSLTLVGRAMAGAFDIQVGSAIPLLATCLTLIGSLSAWEMFHRQPRLCQPQRADAGRRLFDGLLALVPAAMTGFAVSVNAAPVTLATVTCLVIGGLAFVVISEATRQVETIEERDRTDEGNMTGAVPYQQMHRHRIDGREEIEAVVTATFTVGQRETSVHLPIHPVLRGPMEVECEPLDEQSVAIQPTDVQPFGIRIQVKRSDGIDTAAEVPIGVMVVAESDVSESIVAA